MDMAASLLFAVPPFFKAGFFASAIFLIGLQKMGGNTYPCKG